VDVEKYEEGGQNAFVHHFAGRTKHPRLVLQHGLSPLDGLWGWHQDVVAGNVQRRNGTIYLLNKQQFPLLWWNVLDALPVKWTGPHLNAMPAAVAFESIELVHRGISRALQTTAESAVPFAISQFVAAATPGGGFF
jgi:phage tail-like protein